MSSHSYSIAAGWQRLGWWALLLLSSVLLTACPAHHLRNIPAEFYFAGRLALTQEAPPEDPTASKAWSAHFELAGNIYQGNLRLTTPVGTTVAQVNWAPGIATVQTSDETLSFSNLNELTQRYFQQTVPIVALFDWLAGKPTVQEVPGWQVDFSRAGKGIITAQRQTPKPRVRLRAIVDIQENRASELPATAL